MSFMDDKNFGCCGVISSWEVKVGRNGVLELQVWRPEGTTFKLIGENVFTVTGVSSFETRVFVVPFEDLIPVKSTDFLGWRAADGEIVAHDYDSSYSERVKRNISTPDFPINSTFTFSEKLTNTRFGIRALLSPGNEPSFLNLPVNVSVASSGSDGIAVFTPNAVDNDTWDTLTFFEAGTPSGFFSVDSNTGLVTVIPSTLPPGIHFVVIKVMDTCDLTDTEVLTIISTSLSINNLPNTTSVLEETSMEMNIFNIELSYIGTGTITCSIPGGLPFTVTEIDATTVDVSVVSNSDLDSTVTSSYLFDVTCSDGLVTKTASLNVSIQPRTPPQFQNLQDGLTVSAKFTASSENVYNVTANSVEDNVSLTYSMDCPGCPFILHSDINTPPFFLNLPFSLDVPETTPPGALLYNVTESDADDGDALSITLASVIQPPSGTNLFNVTITDGLISLKSTADIDYETISDHNFTIEFSLSDGIASVTSQLVVMVTDVIEPPTFPLSVYTMTAEEGKTGDILPNHPYIATDPNGNDVIYSIVTSDHSYLFTINSTNGALFYSEDNILNHIPSGAANITIRATNQHGVYSDVDLYIVISPANVKPRIVVPAQVTIQESHTVGWWIATLPIEDDDGDVVSYRVLYYPTMSHSTFTVLRSGDTLNVSLADSIDYETTSGYNLTFIVNDGIEDSDSATLQILIEDVSEPPVFSAAQYNASVIENDNSTLVFDGLSVSDVDAGDTVSLSIISGNHDNHFRMDSSGNIFFDVDYDVDLTAFSSTANLVIQAVDSAMLTATTQLTIIIEDANDNAPVLDSNSYVKAVNDSVAMGSALLTVVATDADDGMNGEVLYKLILPDSVPDIFTISHSGEIIVKQSLANYSGQIYDFNISVTDKGSPPMATVAMVTVIVTETSYSESVASLNTAALRSSSSDDASSFIEQPGVMAGLGAAAGVAVASSVGSLAYLALKRRKIGNQSSNAPTESTPNAGGKNTVKPTQSISNETQSAAKLKSSQNPDIRKPSMQKRPSMTSSTSIGSSEFDFWNDREPFAASTPGAGSSRLSVASLSGVNVSSITSPQNLNFNSFTP
ncbi:protocadherin Fat 3-like [Argopecten irradians]|uniref:protocadherin Fat 3-like n=1 Tax=Argopecten irradians TaxID=31199 RepID=UPI003722C6C9